VRTVQPWTARGWTGTLRNQGSGSRVLAVFAVGPLLLLRFGSAAGWRGRAACGGDRNTVPVRAAPRLAGRLEPEETLAARLLGSMSDSG
jgi:hypothetical protein